MTIDWLWMHPIIVFVFSYIAKILTIIIIISELFGQVFWLVNNRVSCAKTTDHIDLLSKWNSTKLQEAIQYWVINNFRCCLPTAFLKSKIQLYSFSYIFIICNDMLLFLRQLFNNFGAKFLRFWCEKYSMIFWFWIFITDSFLHYSDRNM